MKTQLTKDVDLIVESEDSGEISLRIEPNGEVWARLCTKCCTCSTPLQVEFNLGNRLPVEPAWSENVMKCNHCQLRQMKKVRYFIEARGEFVCRS